MRWLAGNTDSKLQEAVRDREAWLAAVHEVAKRLDDWTRITNEGNSGKSTLLLPQRGHNLLLPHIDRWRESLSSSVRRTGGEKGAMRKEAAESGEKGGLRDSEGKLGPTDSSGLWIKPRFSLSPPRVFSSASQGIPFVLFCKIYLFIYFNCRLITLQYCPLCS